MRPAPLEHVDRDETLPSATGEAGLAPSRRATLTRGRAAGTKISPMPQSALAPLPIHGEYRQRGDKVD
jgi:hypothetical protein